MKQHSLRSAFSTACLFALMFCLPALAHAATLNVPAQYATIQAAVNAAQSGDTVLIADGTYTGPGNVDIDFNGKNITVTSVNGSASTIINCGGSSSANHRGFYLHSGETNAIISGLTIKNGYESIDNGGGILNSNVSATVRNCTIQNSVANNGGGVFDETNGAIAVINCSVTSNLALTLGGGVENDSYGVGTITLTNCTVSGNTAYNSSSPYSGDGGGLYNTTSDTGAISLVGSSVIGNTASYGGGLYNNYVNVNPSEGGTITITGCTVIGNTAYFSGGGAENDNFNDDYTGVPVSLMAMTNCVFAGNVAEYGSAMYNYNSYRSLITLTSCTLTGNDSTLSGGCVYNANIDLAKISLTNDILYGDIGGEITNDPNSITPATSSFCDVQGGYAGSGNISVAPAFVSGASPYDLHLTSGSPCLGAGTASGTPALTLDARTRPNPPSIGAYEAETGTGATTTTLTSSLNPSQAGQSVTLTATVAGSGGTPTGTIIFIVDGITEPSVPLIGQTAVFTTSPFLTGSHTITASYSGDTSFDPSNSSVLTQIAQAVTTTTALASSLNPSSFGQQITFTVSVTGSDPRGAVTLTDTATGTVLGSRTEYGTGQVAIPVSGLTAGIHQIVASFSGDKVNSASASAALTQVVNRSPTVTTLTSNQNPSIAGQSITLTATIAGSGGTPTGSVTFTIAGTAQTPVTLSSGTASYAISSLALGVHTITATYNGDANFTPSTSQPLTQTVNPHVSPEYVSLLGSDSNPGTMAAPKLTIQAAINSTLSGDMVVVEDGTYTGPGDVDLDFSGKNITVTSQDGASATIIDCQGTSTSYHRGFTVHSGETNAIISGFTIQNGYEGPNGLGGGIYRFDAGMTVQNCILKNNQGVYGGGIYAFGGYYDNSGAVSISNCVFTGNTANYGGAGIYGGNPSGSNSFAVTNCTLTGNTAAFGAGFDGNTYPSTVLTTLTNDIFYGDSGSEIVNEGNGTSSAAATYCDIQGNYGGTGNIDADPMFVNSPTDLHLGAGSPCLGAGTALGAPTTTIDGRTRPNPPSIGAYEGVPVATTVSVSNVSGTAGQSVTLSAALTATSGGGLSGKTLSFSVDGVAAGTAGTNGMGTASLTYAIPGGTATGSHAISVTFAGDSAGNASSGTGALTVTAPVPVGQVRYWPRSTYPARMVGGLFQGSSDNAHWTTLATVTQTPPVNAYSTLTTSADPATFRYLRYLAPNGSYGNVAEIEFDSHGVKLTGTGFGTAGSYNNSGNTFAKALDGNTGTFFDAPAPGNGDYVGIDRGTLTHTKLTGTAFGTAGSYKNDGNTFGNVFDGNLSTFFDAPAASGDDAGIDLGTGQAAIVTRIGYCPRSGYASRMVGGVFQGSNDNSSWTALYTVTAAPATGALTQTTAISSGTAYRYLRYVAPNGSYGNVSEVEFDTSP